MAQISLDVEAARRSSRSLAFTLLFGVLLRSCKAEFVVNAMGLLQVDLPPFTTQKDMDASVAVPDACTANLFDPSFETGLLAATGFVMIGGPIELQDAACAPDRYAPFVTDRRRQLALASRPQIFRRMTS